MDFNVVYFDTNIFYHAMNGHEILSKDWSQMLQLTDERVLKRFFSPITFVEVGSHINFEEKDRFPYFKEVFQFLKRCCNANILNHPESVLKSYFNFTEEDDANEIIPVVDLILSASNYEALVETGQIGYWYGQLSRVKLEENYLDKFRADYEVNWCNEIYQNIIDASEKWFAEQKESVPKSTRKDSEKQILSLIQSDYFKRIFLENLSTRARVSLIAPIIEKDFQMFLDPVDAYFSFYKYIVSKMVTTGYKPEKNKNDFHDWNLLLYLGLRGYLFVTNEGKFKKAVADSKQKNQVMNFAEFLNYLRQGS